MQKYKFQIILVCLCLLIPYQAYAEVARKFLPDIPRDKLEEKCRPKLNNFPFAYNPETAKFFTMEGTNPVEDNNASYENVINSKTQLAKLFDLCRCTEEITRRGVFGVETTDAKKSSWAQNFLTQNSACGYIKEVSTRKLEGAGSGVTSRKYCLFTRQDHENLKMSRSMYKQMDQDNDCTIGSTNREKCLLKRYEIQNGCKTAQSPDTTINNIQCKEAYNVQCVGDNEDPEVLDFNDGFTSESLNIEKVLKTTGQKGFQNIQDQGAGTNNPGINLILYIINTLANLSFLISVFMLIMAGFYTVIASGNTEMNNKAKAAIKYFVMAVTFTLLSYSIVTLIKALIYS